MLNFCQLINALRNDELADVLKPLTSEKKEDDNYTYENYVIEESVLFKQSVHKMFPDARESVVLNDYTHNVSVTVDMIIQGKYLNADLIDECNSKKRKKVLGDDVVYPVIITNHTLQYCVDSMFVRMDDTIKICKAKLFFACNVLNLQYGIVIGKNHAQGLVEFSKYDTLHVQHAIQWATDVMNVTDKMCFDPPSRLELYPNMGVESKDRRVQKMKKELAHKNMELTLMSGITLKHRNHALKQGITRLDDPNLDAETLGFKPKDKKFDLINAMIQCNHSDASFDASNIPTKCDTGDAFVDFETLNLCKEFKNYLFMIGIGVDADAVDCYTTTDISLAQERIIVQQFLERLQQLETKRILHWGEHERIILAEIEKRHALSILEKFEFVDMCLQFKKLQWVPKNAFTFSVKSFAYAMHGHGMIKTIWDSNCQDGFTAMFEAWKAYQTKDWDTLRDIEKYNIVDVVTMMEIWRFVKSVDMIV
jgi:hypothetical protein